MGNIEAGQYWVPSPHHQKGHGRLKIIGLHADSIFVFDESKVAGKVISKRTLTSHYRPEQDDVCAEQDDVCVEQDDVCAEQDVVVTSAKPEPLASGQVRLGTSRSTLGRIIHISQFDGKKCYIRPIKAPDVVNARRSAKSARLVKGKSVLSSYRTVVASSLEQYLKSLDTEKRRQVLDSLDSCHPIARWNTIRIGQVIRRKAGGPDMKVVGIGGNGVTVELVSNGSVRSVGKGTMSVHYQVIADSVDELKASPAIETKAQPEPAKQSQQPHTEPSQAIVHAEPMTSEKMVMLNKAMSGFLATVITASVERIVDSAEQRMQSAILDMVQSAIKQHFESDEFKLLLYDSMSKALK